MALERLTKVDGKGLDSPLNFDGQIDGTQASFSGIVTATGGIQAIGIYSGGTAIHSGVITALNFIGTGNTITVHNNRVDISISGGGGGASVVYDSTVFAYQNVIDSNIIVAQPYKASVIYSDPDITVDIESGFQLSIDEGCILNIIDL